jgi:hypothetical protein
MGPMGPDKIGGQTYSFHVLARRDEAVGGVHPTGSRRRQAIVISPAALGWGLGVNP